MKQGMDDKVINQLYNSLLEYKDLKSNIEVPDMNHFDEFTKILNEMISKNYDTLDGLRHISEELSQHLSGVKDCLFNMEKEFETLKNSRKEFFGWLYKGSAEKYEDPVEALSKGLY